MAEVPGAAPPRRRQVASMVTRLDVTFHPLNVEIAATESERSQGLSFRDSLPEYDGMLFVLQRSRSGPRP